MINFFSITDTVRHLFLIFISFSFSFLIAVLIAPFFIKKLKTWRLGKQIRQETIDGKVASLFHALHQKKQGTPTMGGILIWGTALLVIILTRLLSFFGIIDHSLINRKETYLPIFTLITVALLGALDDYLNIKNLGKTKGLAAKPKLLWLIIFAGLGAWWFYFKLGYNQIHIPGIGDFIINAWYIPLFIFIIIATANAVNITDGLDGLSAGLSIIAFSSFAGIAYMKGLFILSAFCAIISGATLAFLWFNIPPAKFYMGDTGSLALGATLGVIALLTNSVLILPFIGFIFVIETLSVIIQLTSKKIFHRKIFHIAPLHHHFEQLGWPEHQITMRFWMVGGIVAAFGLIIGLIGMGN
ncbi:MAG: phospho-N-acetylmuramoyl-pentapeptide-transferase, phospho-N-acetylmuramoyl-pentapeptide-transferase [Candidatus Peregrinibacteria bacterium GW2011_GWE2_39_6]|nr:MAG: phospho-N-acetylmuramoyl-pentapeptide-transferase, phospho-N-acetylmuramoyl-pentapeptide-transferase [Candidatus Peregrinibacteria bacterium GW2011_GWF2_39_17]KKR23383.1 MAG: phospho-N-acetylmuramoyl-pentapeptide-transferase, phospho-N-acetylmuramoyl-pentapeptide-transferase [Candidatus Peregrinibacteria bacterium GW2011_GWE2_39_6]HCW32199.1 phospho-N-acetylmuramoyl-pentapeptide-transferase [Candidatus Peregrinibacteria bacterium]